jgi:hypothetical protein
VNRLVEDGREKGVDGLIGHGLVLGVGRMEWEKPGLRWAF